MNKYSKQDCEYIRYQAKSRFDKIRGTWCDLLRWGAPHRSSWILSTTPGERKNQHILDGTHILSLRSYVAGFLEGNTSATRQWGKIETRDAEAYEIFENKEWLQHYTSRVFRNLSSSNFYHAAGNFYYDYGVVNTGAHYIEETDNSFFFHTLMPGSYYVLNNSYGEACVLVREFSLNAKAVVDTYGQKDKNGKVDWSNISSGTKKLYQDSNYTQMVDIVHIVKENPHFDPEEPDAYQNKKWLELTYELGGPGGHQFSNGVEFGDRAPDNNNEKFLRIHTTRRKPFIVGKSTEDFEYGEKGPTLDALGLIKSLNKKAISKDMAIEQTISPATQGPASLRKSYISTAPGTFVPLDARSISAKQKLESIFNIGPGFAPLFQDVEDLRRMVDKFYYADFLLFLSNNPKTRSATEAAGVMEEQKRVIGPNLQSLNTTYNDPVLDWVMDWTLYEDGNLRPPPETLSGHSMKVNYISVFAQAQKAADLPSVSQYVRMMQEVAQIDPKILDKFNTDKLADIYEDRLYLPSGLNHPQGKVEAMREQAQKAAQRQQMLEQTLPAVAKAGKDMSSINGQQQQS